MTIRKTNVPAIPPLPPGADIGAVKRVADALKEATEVAFGRRGDPLDRHVTLRELKDAGVVNVTIQGGSAGVQAPQGTGQPGAPVFDPGDPDFGGDDFSTPPAPTGVFARGVGENSIMIGWNQPGYGNHAYAEVFGLRQGHLFANPFDAMIGFTPTFNRSRPHDSNNLHALFVGAALGSQFMHRDLVRGDESTIDGALNPAGYSYFVRFVSFAGVPGPFAPVPQGARGALTIDPARVMDALTAGVTNSPVYQRLQRVINIPESIRQQVINAGNLSTFLHSETQSVRQDLTVLEGAIGDTSFLGVNETLAEIVRNSDDSIDNLWTVRLNTTFGGTTYAAGFGLGLRVDAENGTAQSDFVVAADRFSIVGISPFSGTEVGPPLVPFVVDTQRGVVGIRGSLIVDGLVRATTGDFNDLTARTAFIDRIRAQTLNANVVIGNRIIAGVPAPADGSGQISDIGALGTSQYIVELASPVVGPGVTRSPFRYYKPGTVIIPGFPPTGEHVVAELTAQGDFRLGGNLSVGKNAVINTTSGNFLTSIGGSGADTGANEYALWIGPRSVYGSNGLGRTEKDALLFVRTDGRAGFNAELFLGEDPLTLPSGDGIINVRPTRSGGLARVFLSACVSLAPVDELGNCAYGADLYLVSESYVGPGAGSVRSGVGLYQTKTFLDRHVGLFETGEPAAPSTLRAAHTTLDSRGGSSDIKNLTIQGSVTAPSGLYKVFLAIWRKVGVEPSGTKAHGCFSASMFAVQVER